jgi:hypothetical protein
MPDVDDTEIATLVARTLAETSAPFEYGPLTWSSVRTPDGYTLPEASRDTRAEYESDLQELGDYLTIGQGEQTARANGSAPPVVLTRQLADQWDYVLRDARAERHGLANYLKQHYRGQMADEQARIRDLTEQAARQQRAFQEVKDAIADKEYAERWTGILLKINEGYEALANLSHGEVQFDPAAITLEAVNFTRSQVYGVSKLVEKGIEDLGDYSVALALVSAGYASIDELNNDARTTMEALQGTNDQLANDTAAAARAAAAEDN